MFEEKYSFLSPAEQKWLHRLTFMLCSYRARRIDLLSITVAHVLGTDTIIPLEGVVPLDQRDPDPANPNNWHAADYPFFDDYDDRWMHAFAFALETYRARGIAVLSVATNRLGGSDVLALPGLGDNAAGQAPAEARALDKAESEVLAQITIASSRTAL